MRAFITVLLLIMSICLMAKDYRPLDPVDTSQLVEMLSGTGLDSLDLAFEKDWDLSTRFKMESQMRVLQNPWLGLEELARWRELNASQELIPLADELLREAWQLDMPRGNPSDYVDDYTARLSKAGSSPSKLAKAWSAILDELKPNWQSGFAKPMPLWSSYISRLTPPQIDSLRAFWFQACSEAEDADKYALFIKDQQLPKLEEIDLASFATLFDSIDFYRLRETALRFMAATQALEAQAAKLKFHKSKAQSFKTPHGLIIFGSRGEDVYKTSKQGPVCLIIDPSGRDRYELPLQASYSQPFFCLLDMEGDDVYANNHPAALFSAALGVSVSKDLSGRDIYQGDDFSFASYLGLTIHTDRLGDDLYQTGMFSQGAALFGASLLMDEAGNDRYDATSQAQGFASTRAVGLLADKRGDDVYYLGGRYYHAPLMPLDHRTLGQGMGFGFRPDYAGGTGIIYDGDGNDRYLGGVYAQGVGYWYASGMLIDEAGNDTYSAVYYPQGSGIHLACGLLYDGSGDDAYYSRNGPGQGAAHDWGMGMFIDGAGNDAYSIQGGQGLGLSNSAAIFVDRSGDDRYERKEAQNYGNGAFSRGTASLGLFLDLGGKDSYPDSLMANDKTWQKGSYGIGRDVELRPTLKTAVEELSESAPMPDPKAPIDSLFAIASEWEVGSAVQRVKAARSILKDRKAEAVPYALASKINTRSGLEYRALEALLTDAPEMAQRLYPLIQGADSLAAKNAMSLLAAKPDSLLLSEIQVLLKQDKYIPACLSVLGSFQLPEAVTILNEWLEHPAERFRYIAARSLSQIGSPDARAILKSRQSDPSFLVKGVIRALPQEEDNLER